MSFDTLPDQGDEGETWLGGWTAYDWGWWMSWSPVVGIFIACISCGRAVREFCRRSAAGAHVADHALVREIALETAEVMSGRTYDTDSSASETRKGDDLGVVSPPRD